MSNVRKLSKVEESEISIQSVNIYKYINESISIIQKSFQQREVNIQIEPLKDKLYVKANELLLDVIENILINAVKYNENPKIEITIKVSKEKSNGENHIKIEFLDNGIGIEDSRKPIIFRNGHRIQKGGKGMGLGLSLVKKIIKSYDGQLWVEDRIKGDYKKGSNFILMIPEAV